MFWTNTEYEHWRGVNWVNDYFDFPALDDVYTFRGMDLRLNDFTVTGDHLLRVNDLCFRTEDGVVIPYFIEYTSRIELKVVRSGLDNVVEVKVIPVSQVAYEYGQQTGSDTNASMLLAIGDIISCASNYLLGYFPIEYRLLTFSEMGM